MDIAALQTALPADCPPLTPAGEGDYATAFQAGDHIVLVARSAHASRCLNVVARVSPALAQHVSCAIPAVTLSGECQGQTFIVYPAIPGEPLSPGQLEQLEPPVQNAVAEAVGRFLAELQAFPFGQALDAGAIRTDYPFAFLEEHVREGEAAHLYAADLEEAATLLDDPDRRRLAARLAHHLDTLPDLSHVLLHGEISKDHVYFDARSGEVTGFIDLNGMHVGRPARDLLYVIEEYGEAFTRRVLTHLPQLNADATIGELRFLRLWHAVIRMNWMHRHGYARGVAHWQDDIHHLLTEAEPPPPQSN